MVSLVPSGPWAFFFLVWLCFSADYLFFTLMCSRILHAVRTGKVTSGRSSRSVPSSRVSGRLERCVFDVTSAGSSSPTLALYYLLLATNTTTNTAEYTSLLEPFRQP